MNVLSFFKLTKRHVFILISIAFSQKFMVHFLFLFLNFGFYQPCQIKEDQDNKKYFHPNETKTPLILKQIDLV